MPDAAAKAPSDLAELEKQLFDLANQQYDSPQYKRFLSIKFTRERARQYLIQRTYWTVNRRDCWALVQGVAPLAVKKLLWEHERDELEGDKDRGVPDHYTLSLKEGEALGLRPEDYTRTPPMDGCDTCCLAWRYIASHSHWLGGLASSAALELLNSDAILKGGGTSRRIGIKFRDELGIPLKKQHSNAEHMEADVRHASILMDVANVHAKTQWDLDEILRGAKASMAIDRVWKGQLADLLASISD